VIKVNLRQTLLRLIQFSIVSQHQIDRWWVANGNA